jgi:hypothetical protein
MRWYKSLSFRVSRVSRIASHCIAEVAIVDGVEFMVHENVDVI